MKPELKLGARWGPNRDQEWSDVEVNFCAKLGGRYESVSGITRPIAAEDLIFQFPRPLPTSLKLLMPKKMKKHHGSLRLICQTVAPGWSPVPGRRCVLLSRTERANFALSTTHADRAGEKRFRGIWPEKGHPRRLRFYLSSSQALCYSFSTFPLAAPPPRPTPRRRFNTHAR